MRILFVHERFGAFGGAEVNALLTAAELKRREHAVAILHGAPSGKAEAEWREVFSPGFPLQGQSAQRAVESAINQFRPDAIYVHKIADPDVLRALVGSNLPLVRMVHDHDIYCMRSYKYHPLTRNICTRPAGLACIFPCGANLARNRDGTFPLRWVSYAAKKKEIELNKRFHRLIVASDYMRQELLRNNFATNKIEIHAPVPRDNVNATTSSFADSNRIIYAGQIARGKGVDFLLKSLKQIYTSFTCEILGDGHHRARCEQLASELGLVGEFDERDFAQSRAGQNAASADSGKNLNESYRVVHFHGYLPPAQMEKFYSDATVAVVSSVWPEPFGMVGVEAMRRGLPVVAFDVGGVREWLRDGENGFLVPQKDCKQFAARLGQLLNDKPLARRLGENGRRFVREKFGFAGYISGLEKMFAQVIAEAKDGTRRAVAGADESVRI